MTDGDRSRLGGLARGAATGALLGAVWAGCEHLVAWGLGSVAPRELWVIISAFDVGVGVVTGGVIGGLAPGIGGGALALGVTFAFGLCRVVAPPGIGGEALYVVVAVVAWLAGRRLVGADGASLLAGVHTTVLGVAAVLGLDVFLDANRFEHLRGVALVAAVVSAPIAVVAGDRLVAVAGLTRGRRLVAELGAVAAAAVIWATPFDATPRIENVVTGVPPAAGTPDVVLVSLDTTRADALSTYGYERETSPHLTQLAGDGVLFRNARSSAGWTLPGHASMMTGLYPNRHGAHLAGGRAEGDTLDGRPNVAHPLGRQHGTLAELLRDHGFSTGAFVSNFSYLYRDYGLAQGFGVYDDTPGVLLLVRPPAVRALRLVWPAFGVKPFRTATAVNESALAWLDAAPKERPVFLFLNYMEPHQPWVAEAPFDQWAREVPGEWTLARTNLYTHRAGPISARTAEFIRANYDGQVAAMDAALGELVDALKARGRYDGALIVVTSDHGELLGEHSEMGHMGRMLYEPLLHVPLVVKYPAAAARQGTESAPARLVDLLPTVATVLEIAYPEDLDGQPLGSEVRPTFAESGINPFLVEKYGESYDRGIRVVYDGTHKLITTSRGERHLFDLAADPGETVDLAAERPGVVADLAALLDERVKPVVASAEKTVGSRR